MGSAARAPLFGIKSAASSRRRRRRRQQRRCSRRRRRSNRVSGNFSLFFFFFFSRRRRRRLLLLLLPPPPPGRGAPRGAGAALHGARPAPSRLPRPAAAARAPRARALLARCVPLAFPLRQTFSFSSSSSSSRRRRRGVPGRPLLPGPRAAAAGCRRPPERVEAPGARPARRLWRRLRAGPAGARAEGGRAAGVRAPRQRRRSARGGVGGVRGAECPRPRRPRPPTLPHPGRRRSPELSRRAGRAPGREPSPPPLAGRLAGRLPRQCSTGRGHGRQTGALGSERGRRGDVAARPSTCALSALPH